MKLKEGVIVTQVGDNHIVVAAGQAAEKFSGMLKMNGTAAFITQQMQAETDAETVAKAVLEKYEVSPEQALESVNSVAQSLLSLGLLEE